MRTSVNPGTRLECVLNAELVGDPALVVVDRQSGNAVGLASLLASFRHDPDDPVIGPVKIIIVPAGNVDLASPLTQPDEHASRKTPPIIVSCRRQDGTTIEHRHQLDSLRVRQKWGGFAGPVAIQVRQGPAVLYEVILEVGDVLVYDGERFYKEGRDS